ncbi:MAG: DNA-3-methyladenine glycosylase [Anaerolineae bacterium]|nr:DNA-3-methyladenine glycosylase [Anaerolineae bacterium]
MNLTDPITLSPAFYARDVVQVARALLGTRLVRRLDGARIGGTIIEAEAYRGEEDLACHARAGRTPRTAIMYGLPGCAYVYFTYGNHWMLNAVCMAEGFPAAVLIRAIRPEEGVDVIAARRAPMPQRIWTDGPGKLTKALAIDGALNGVDLTDLAGGLWIEPGEPVPDALVLAGPRVGLGATPEPWLSMPWRFRLVAGKNADD